MNQHTQTSQTMKSTPAATLQQLADNGNVQAQFELARCYACGSGVEQNHTLFLEWLTKAAEQGLVDAQLLLGLYYGTNPIQELIGAPNYEEVFARANQTSQGFFKPSENFFGLSDNYLAGLEDCNDAAQAFEWFNKAATQNCAEAQYWLAHYYDVGIGVEQNDTLAFEWFKKSAEQEYAWAYYQLASYYRDGKGVAQDSTLAFKWITKASELADIFFELRTKTTQFGSEVAKVYFFLGDLYHHGNGVAQSDELAWKWYRKAMQYGVKKAFLLVADWAAEGKGCKQDFKLAAKIYDRVDEEYRTHGEHHPEASFKLAELYFKGQGVEQDYQYAAQLYLQEDSADAYYWLGRCHNDGKLRECDDDNYNFWLHGDDNQARCWYGISVGAFKQVEGENVVKLAAYKALGDCYAQDKPPNHGQAEQYYKFLDSDQMKKVEEFEAMTTLPQSRNAQKVLPKRIEVHLERGETDLAKEFVENVKGLERGVKNLCLEFIDQIKLLADQAEELEKKNKELESEIEKKEAAYKALYEKEKEMLSFFTHTMRNALATAPESLRQAIHLLGGDVYEKDTKHYQAINKIAALFSTLSLTDCLIDTFKQSISDPQEFKQSWKMDSSGEATPKWVIASALRQSLNRIIFMSDTTELRKLLSNPETAFIKSTRKSFIEEILPLNVDSQGVEIFYAWTLKHIPAIEVSIIDCDKLNFGVNQIRFSLLFAITSELILNALKYWDGESRIQISWQSAEQDNYVFSVKNHCKANEASNLAGTHKGLAFIKRLLELLGEQAQFVCKSEDQLFTAELILNKALFDGES